MSLTFVTKVIRSRVGPIELRHSFTWPKPQIMVPHSVYGVFPRSCVTLCAALLGSGIALAQGLTITLTASNHNGYAISCFGAKDGVVTANVSGGTPPYFYSWSHGDSTQQVSALAAGFYRVSVQDSGTSSGTAEINLTEPHSLLIKLIPFVYPNAYNISCADCYNGSIQSIVSGGVAPYAYTWNDDVTTPNRSGLGHVLNYSLDVTDANGCSLQSQAIRLTQPERMDWTMEGNAGTDPAQHYIGTSDSAAFVLKSFGQERIRFEPNGGVRLFGPDLEQGPLYVDAEGKLLGGAKILNVPPMPIDPCADGLGPFDYWRPDGNGFGYPMCDPEDMPLLGTLTPHSIKVITNGVEQMRITTTGKVGIGTVPPSGPIDEYRLFVEDGIVTRDVLVKLGTWPDYVFADGYRLMPLDELRAFIERHNHLPGIPAEAELRSNGGVAVGDMQARLVQVVEEQALYILQLEERLQDLEKRVLDMEGTQH